MILQVLCLVAIHHIAGSHRTAILFQFYCKMMAFTSAGQQPGTYEGDWVAELR
jgi:hypothetical protein